MWGRGFLMTDQNVADTANQSLLVATAPGAGYSRFDIVYAGVNQRGAFIGIATGTATTTVISASLNAAWGSCAYDPAIPTRTLPLARVFVGASVTGITAANIFDLRNFTSRVAYL